MSRLQAGVLGVTLEPVAVDEVVRDALNELALQPGRVRLELGETERCGRSGPAAARARQPAGERAALLPRG